MLRNLILQFYWIWFQQCPAVMFVVFIFSFLFPLQYRIFQKQFCTRFIPRIFWSCTYSNSPSPIFQGVKMIWLLSTVYMVYYCQFLGHYKPYQECSNSVSIVQYNYKMYELVFLRILSKNGLFRNTVKCNMKVLEKIQLQWEGCRVYGHGLYNLL